MTWLRIMILLPALAVARIGDLEENDKKLKNEFREALENLEVSTRNQTRRLEYFEGPYYIKVQKVSGPGNAGSENQYLWWASKKQSDGKNYLLPDMKPYDKLLPHWEIEWLFQEFRDTYGFKLGKVQLLKKDHPVHQPEKTDTGVTVSLPGDSYGFYTTVLLLIMMVLVIVWSSFLMAKPFLWWLYESLLSQSWRLAIERKLPNSKLVAKHDQALELKRRYLEECYPWFMHGNLSKEEYAALISFLPRGYPKALAGVILDFMGPCKMDPQHFPPELNTRDMRHAATVTYGFFKNVHDVSFFQTESGRALLDELFYDMRDVGPLFGCGELNPIRPLLKKFFHRLADFQERGEMMCFTVEIEHGSKQGHMPKYLNDLDPQNSDGLTIGIAVNYENMVNNALTYHGSGGVYNLIRRGKICRRSPNRPDGCAYWHNTHHKVTTGDLMANSQQRSYRGLPWKMKVSMVICGGRMWFIIDGVLYDPSILGITDYKYFLENDKLFQPGTRLDGDAESLLVPIIKSPIGSLYRVVDPDPTFSKIYVPGVGPV